MAYKHEVKHTFYFTGITGVQCNVVADYLISPLQVMLRNSLQEALFNWANMF